MEQKIDIKAIRKEIADKAYEWVEQNIDKEYYWGRDSEGPFLDYYSFLNDFKKAMEELIQ